MEYSVVIPAAGQGSRMRSATPKVLLACGGAEADRSSGRSDGRTSLLSRTVALFNADPSCRAIVVCVPGEWRERCEGEISFARRAVAVEGGVTRQESVWRGVSALLHKAEVCEDSIVLVHDAARCCVTEEVVRRVVGGVVEHGAVTAAVPISDALSRAEDGRLTTYVDRDSLWSIQTPQGFLIRDLVDAHVSAQREGVQALDDAALVARSRMVHVVMGDRFNIKVTHPDDLRVAQVILSKGG